MLEAVHTALQLRTGGTEFKAHLSRHHIIAQVINAGNTHVLERMLQAGVEVWQELGHTALVLYRTRYTLGDFNGIALREVALCSGVLIGRVSSDFVHLLRRSTR